MKQGMEPEPDSPSGMAAGKLNVHCDPQLALAAGRAW